MAAVAAAARVGPRAPGGRWLLAGWLLVAIPLPAAVVLELSRAVGGSVSETLFVAGVVSFAVGAFFVLGRDDGDWREGREDDPDPEWWPDFERPFRAYAADVSRRKDPVGTR